MGNAIKAMTQYPCQFHCGCVFNSCPSLFQKKISFESVDLARLSRILNLCSKDHKCDTFNRSLIFL